MVQQAYGEKLQHPLWQKKRLEVLNRDEFTCLLCSDTQTTLQIHHERYDNGAEPWEYENDNFKTLCKHCHAAVEYCKDKEIKIIAIGKQVVSGNSIILTATASYCRVISIITFAYLVDKVVSHTEMPNEIINGAAEVISNSKKILKNG